MSTRLNPKKSEKTLACLITEGTADSGNFQAVQSSILEKTVFARDAGVDFVQIREKLLSIRLLVELVRNAVEVCRDSKTRIIVNDRFDVAIATRAAGVQLTSASIPTELVRAVSPPELLIGVSTHSADEVESARDAGADFVLFGPVFDTPSKRKFGSPQGIEQLRKVCRDAEDFPVIAVGGIDSGKIASVINAGAAGFAAIRLFGRPGFIEGVNEQDD